MRTSLRRCCTFQNSTEKKRPQQKPRYWSSDLSRLERKALLSLTEKKLQALHLNDTCHYFMNPLDKALLSRKKALKLNCKVVPSPEVLWFSKCPK